LARTHRFATIQNVTDRQTTDRRQTTHCTIGSTDSTVGQKRRFQRYIVRMEIFSTFHTRVEYISVKTVISGKQIYGRRASMT